MNYSEVIALLENDIDWWKNQLRIAEELKDDWSIKMCQSQIEDRQKMIASISKKTGSVLEALDEL